MLARICNRRTDFRAKLDHRLVHLGLDLFLQQNFAAFENFLNVRSQLARLRIDDGKFLFDAQGVDVIFRSHFVQQPLTGEAAQVRVDRCGLTRAIPSRADGEGPRGRTNRFLVRGIEGQTARHDPRSPTTFLRV